MSDKLKPCPFCGSVMIAECSETDDDIGVEFHFVRCTDCCSHSGYHQTSELSVSAWNRREGISALEAELAAERRVVSAIGKILNMNLKPENKVYKIHKAITESKIRAGEAGGK